MNPKPYIVGHWQPRKSERRGADPRCGEVYTRHSKSIDTARMRCGRCRGALVFVGKFQVDGTPARTRAPAAFSLFVQQNFASVKAASIDKSHAAVMRRLAALWKASKAAPP